MVNKLTSGGVMTISAGLGDLNHPPPVKGDTGSVKKQHWASEIGQKSRSEALLSRWRSGNDLKSKWNISGMPNHLMVWRGK